MACRATEFEVQQILKTEVSSETLTPFIKLANLMVEEFLIALNPGYSEGRYFEIERWLAAHLAMLKDPLVASEKVGEAAIGYHFGKAGMGLDYTPYGQMVQLLDSKKILSTLQAANREFEVKVINTTTER